MNPATRLAVISFALFCATASLVACSSGGGGDAPTASPQTSQSAGIARRTFLNSAQIVSSSPPVSAATGTAAIVLDTATGRLTGSVTLSGTANPVSAVHINDGDAGTNGDPVVSLTETPAGSGTWTIPDTAVLITGQVDRFKAAGFYVVVDTSANPGGEIRGQLLSYSENIQPVFDGHCVGCHGGAGAAGLALNKTNSYGRLVNQPSAASSGVRVVPFDAAGSVLYRRISGTGFAGASRMPPNGPYLSASDDGLLKAWINMGAIDDNGVSPVSAVQGTQFTRRAFLNGKQIVAAVPSVSSATGSAVMALDTTTSRLTGTVVLANMTSAATAVHINDGDAGSNGSPVVSLTETPPGSGTWTATATALNAGQMDRFKTAGFYVSVDTAVSPGGEIRGQLLSYADNIQQIFNVNCAGCHYTLGLANFTGLLLPAAESYAGLVNKPATQSTGARVVPFDADNSVLFSRISGAGFAAMVGPQMPPPGPAFSLLTPRDQNLIKAWINSGAIDDNGVVQSPQPVPPQQFARSAFLNDKQVVTTPVSSAATGTAAVTLDTGTGKLTGSVVLSNMTNTVSAVHIDDGDAGSTGSPIVSLAETPAGSGVWTIPDTMAALTPVQMNRLIAAGLYVSVDTNLNPGGEIRGQFLSYAGNVQSIFTIRCIQCHNFGPDLRSGNSYVNLVGVPAQQQTTGTRVIPFDAANSVLYQRVIGAGPAGFRMPFDGPPFLSPREENIIKTWIDMGAAND